jgi:TIR domain
MTAKSTKSNAPHKPKDLYHAFLSHASQDADFANTVAASLHRRRLKTWIDNSNLSFGTLLRDELRSAIENSRVVILLWSQAATQSRWVMAEIFTAFHLNRFIIPCVLDDTPLPQFLQNTAYLNRKRDEADIGEKLARAIRQAPDAANQPAPWLGTRTQLVESLVNGIGAAQIGVVLAMNADFQKASEANEHVGDALKSAHELAPYDPMILNLAGYQCKNDYMFAHQPEIRAGRPPKDPLLIKGESYFFDALCVDPSDASAVNGLGSILMFELELDAAEFFVRRAIDIRKRTGQNYEAAEHDLDLILYFKERQATPGSQLS